MPTKAPASGRWLLKAAIGLIAIIATFAVDDAVTNPLQLQPQGGLYALAGWLSKYGDWPPILAAGVVCALILIWLHRVQPARLLLCVVLAGMISGFSATIIRSFTGRTRPDAKDAPQGFYGPRYQSHWIIGKSEFGSFPSGHTATVAGLAAAAWLVSRRFGLVATVFALGVAWSRIALRKHHFSDVVAAAVLGIWLGPWLFRLLELKTRRTGVAPVSEL